MKHEKRSKWSSQATFILAAIGSAVGLGNAWRFPGLAAKHGGGTYLLIYLVALFVVGIPLLIKDRVYRMGSNIKCICYFYLLCSCFRMGNFDDGMLGKICRYDRRCKCGAESFCRSNTDNMGYQRF